MLVGLPEGIRKWGITQATWLVKKYLRETSARSLDFEAPNFGRSCVAKQAGVEEDWFAPWAEISAFGNTGPVRDVFWHLNHCGAWNSDVRV